MPREERQRSWKAVASVFTRNAELGATIARFEASESLVSQYRELAIQSTGSREADKLAEDIRHDIGMADELGITSRDVEKLKDLLHRITLGAV